MKSFTYLLVCSQMLSQTPVRNATNSCLENGHPKLIFDEQFNKFDLKKWKHDITASGGGNWEFQYYTNNRTNSFVKNGKLYLYPTLTFDKYGSAFEKDGFELNLEANDDAASCTGNAFYGCKRVTDKEILVNPVQSALIRTSDSISITYGRVDVRAKLPRGDWLWPAIWMMPKYNQYGSWPASGEIDILESRGNQYNTSTPTTNKSSRDYVTSTLHWGVSYEYNKFKSTTNGINLNSFKTKKDNQNDEFHTYSLIWTSEKIQTLVNNKVVLNVDFNKHKSFYEFGNFPKNFNNPWTSSENAKAAPFDQEFYLIINLAVGGTNSYFDDKLPNKPWKNKDKDAAKKFWSNRSQWLPTWKNDLSRAFSIDYVKIWSYC